MPKSPLRMRARSLICLMLGGVALSASAGAAGPDVEVVDLSVRPAMVSLSTAPGAGFAAAYDDRLSGGVLRYAERGQTRWRAQQVAKVVDGRRVGREPSLAVSKTGLRLIAFRTDIELDEGKLANSLLYVARAFQRKPWRIERLDENGFGAQAAFDRDGRPAVAYLVRTDTSDLADVRLAQRYEGTWQVQTIARTSFRQARSKANATRLGLAFDKKNRPWVAFVDDRNGSVRLATTDGEPSLRVGSVPPEAAQATIAFGSGDAQAVAVAGLAGEDAGLWTVSRTGPAGRWRMARVGGSGATAPSIIGFERRRPLIAFLDRRGVQVARPLGKKGKRFDVQTVLRSTYGSSTTYNGSLGAALRRGRLGIAQVAPRGLLVFSVRGLTLLPGSS